MKKTRLVYKIYKERRAEFIQSNKKDKKNWCYWTWKFLKDIHLEHVWESEKFEIGKDFHNLVKEALQRKDGAGSYSPGCPSLPG